MIKIKLFFFRILSIFNSHMRGEGRRFFKETYSDVYPKGPNSWIQGGEKIF